MKIAKKTKMLVMAVLCVCASTVFPVQAAYHGLVVGINKYPHTQNLSGAVNDARDIADGLKVFGVRDIIMLLDREATREAIIRAWENMLAQSRRGDTIIFSYAGHGGQEKEKVPGSEKDGKDESLLLGGFNPKTKAGLHQRILDNEINSWFKKADRKGVKVIFIADACHSGGATRSLDGRVAVGFRSGPPYSIDDEEEELSAEAVTGAAIRENDLSNLLLLAATQEQRRSPEVLINGRYRGALSRAFGQALRGEADVNKDGVTSRFELDNYIRANVRNWTDTRQTPEILPLAREDRPVLHHIRAASTMNAGIGDLPRLRLAVLNMQIKKARDIIKDLVDVDFAGPGMKADLIWDAGDGSVISSSGDEVARSVVQADLGHVTDKWRVLLLLKSMAERAPLAMTMDPDDSLHKLGQIITFRSAPLQYPFMTAFNLASKGEVQFVYPQPEERDVSKKGEAFELPLKVQPPFGADHLILIASSHPLSELHRRLSSAMIGEVASILTTELQDSLYQIGIQPLFTIEEEGQ
jgi:hypothetical protein